jgi:hypothetical protein
VYESSKKPFRLPSLCLAFNKSRLSPPLNELTLHQGDNYSSLVFLSVNNFQIESFSSVKASNGTQNVLIVINESLGAFSAAEVLNLSQVVSSRDNDLCRGEHGGERNEI